MIEFDIKDRKLTVHPEVLTVNAFNDIWDYDKTKSKSKASNMLVYVFHMCDIRDKNPFRDTPVTQREALAKKNAFGDKDFKFTDEEQAMVDRAMAWYSVLNKNSVMRLSLALDKKIDELTEFYENNKIKTMSDLDDQTDSMAKIDRILKAKKTADEFSRNETEKKKVKGDAVRSPLAEGILDGKR